MAFCVGSATAGGLCSRRSSYLPSHNLSFLPQTFLLSNPSSSASFSIRRRSAHVTGARKISSRTGRFDGKNKRSGGATTTKEEEEAAEQERDVIERGPEDSSTVDVDDGYFLPELPGDKPDFWEGARWDGLGFFVQYMWAFGIGFALIACGIAVATYNEGAMDFKQTPVYKESIQSRELLEEPEASNSDVFEANPTEEAPTVE